MKPSDISPATMKVMPIPPQPLWHIRILHLLAQAGDGDDGQQPAQA